MCVIDLFSKYSRVIPLKNIKGDSIVEGFQSILNKSRNAKHSKRKPNKICVDHGSEFYNSKFKKYIQKMI